MINEEETKEMFIERIDDIIALDRAVYIIEDKRELLKENLKLQQELTDYKERNEKATKFIYFKCNGYKSKDSIYLEDDLDRNNCYELLHILDGTNEDCYEDIKIER